MACDSAKDCLKGAVDSVVDTFKSARDSIYAHFGGNTAPTNLPNEYAFDQTKGLEFLKRDRQLAREIYGEEIHLDHLMKDPGFLSKALLPMEETKRAGWLYEHRDHRGLGTLQPKPGDEEQVKAPPGGTDAAGPPAAANELGARSNAGEEEYEQLLPKRLELKSLQLRPMEYGEMMTTRRLGESFTLNKLPADMDTNAIINKLPPEQREAFKKLLEPDK